MDQQIHTSQKQTTSLIGSFLIRRHINKNIDHHSLIKELIQKIDNFLDVNVISFHFVLSNKIII
jgi:hypothetical protein